MKFECDTKALFSALQLVSTVIPGMRRVANVDANTSVSDGILLDDITIRKLKDHAFTHGWSYPWSA